MLQILHILVSLKSHISLYLICVLAFSLNVLSWAAYLIRVITINVWLLAQSFIGLLCFHVIFFLSLIMSTFIKNYNHSIHISFWTHIFQEIFALELYLVASVFYLPNPTVLHFSNRRAFIFSPFLYTFILQYHCQVKSLSFYLSQPPFLHHSLPFFWTLHLKNGSYMAIKKVQTRQSNIVLKYDFISYLMSM